MQVNPASLRALRLRSGWSQTKFADAVGTQRSHLANIEAGRRQPSPDLVQRMAKALDVPVMAIISNFSPEEVA